MEKLNKQKKPLIVALIIIVSIVLSGSGAYLAYINFTKAEYIMGVVGLVLAILGLVILCWLIGGYNKLIAYRNKVNESLSLIDVQLKQRFDLIPNLVNTVKGYAKHEYEVFTQITELRSRALLATEEKEVIELSNKSLSKLKQIVAIAEDYPTLQADSLYRSLMEELVLIEDKIVASRRFYDSNVNLYNTTIEVWPSNILANIFGHAKMELFRIDAGERLNVNVSKSFEE